MAAASPELSPGVVLKRIHGFINRMTSGVVYSIVMHSLIMTAYAWGMFQIFKTNEFDDLDQVMDEIGLSFFYLMFVVAEIAIRWWCEEPVCVTISGHCAHLIGTAYLTAYLDPSNPEALLFPFVVASLWGWTFLVLFAHSLPACQRDGSLTEPLV